MRVLHFKSRYLNASETFVDRLVRGHVAFEPAVATVEPRQYADGLRLYAPRSRLERFVNEDTGKFYGRTDALVAELAALATAVVTDRRDNQNLARQVE